MTRVAVAALFVVVALRSAIAAPAQASLCGAGEMPLFTCPLGHKFVSICDSGGTATYYFGVPGKVEISSKALFTAEHGFSGGGETQISFRNKAYSYTVFDKTTRTSFSSDGANDPDFTAGLFVQKSGKTISTTPCGSDASISAKATGMIPAGPFIEH